MNLYELTNEYVKMSNMLSEFDVEPDVLKDTLDSIQEPIEIKVENITKLIRQYEQEAILIEHEAKRLLARAERKADDAKRLKEYIAENLLRANIDKVEGKLFTFSFRKSTSVNVVNESLISKEYKTTKVVESIDKKLIGEALKSGIEVAGCELLEKKNLQIK